MDWYQLVWKRYAEFQGRSRRKEYWMFALFNTLITIVLELLGFALLKAVVGIVFFVLLGLYSVAALVPSLAVSVRRLHDTGKSGWWLLIGLIPIVGVVILFVFLVLDSAPETNLYGPNPKLAAQPPAIG